MVVYIYCVREFKGVKSGVVSGIKLSGRVPLSFYWFWDFWKWDFDKKGWFWAFCKRVGVVIYLVIYILCYRGVIEYKE